MSSKMDLKYLGVQLPVPDCQTVRSRIKKMIVYLVLGSSGNYDDHVSWTEKVFLIKHTAEDFVNRKNRQIKRLKKAIPKEVWDDKTYTYDFDHPNWQRYNWIANRHEYIIKEMEAQ